MKYLLIISCLLFTSVGWSKDINFDDLVKREKLYYEKFTDVPFTGNVTGRIQGKLKNGYKDGNWIIYFENGNLQDKSNYKDGKIEGEWLTYHDNGQLEKTEIWKENRQMRDKR